MSICLDDEPDPGALDAATSADRDNDERRDDARERGRRYRQMWARDPDAGRDDGQQQAWRW